MQGTSAELIATKWGITREDMDAFAVQSHQRAATATAEGRFDNEIIPVKQKHFDRETKAILPAKAQAIQRIVDLGMERGLLLYSRRTANGQFGEWLMIAPPLIVDGPQIDTIAALIGETLAAFEQQLR